MDILFRKKRDTNKALIEEVILGNYDQYYRLAYRYVHNEDDASDIVQDGAYKALKSSHTLKDPAFAQTWVYRIMLNECFQHLRKPKAVSYDALQEAGGAGAGYAEDRYADVDLLRAVDALPERDKAIVILRYFEDKKLDEIAGILDESVNTVKSRLYRCMKKLRDALSEGDVQQQCQLRSRMGG
ncbi:MAG: sigma-70 family RNA polymerase sigma factor [Ruminococcus flavefaciens]|nr:sigma-70 family RNA polymerase sigma factor [Ruminococcus flavefaciens]